MRFLSQHNQVKGAQISLIVMKPPLEKGCDNYFLLFFYVCEVFFNSFITKLKQVITL